MPVHLRCIAALLLALGLSACAGNYTFDDDEYRSLGDPLMVSRGQ